MYIYGAEAAEVEPDVARVDRARQSVSAKAPCIYIYIYTHTYIHICVDIVIVIVIIHIYIYIYTYIYTFAPQAGRAQGNHLSSTTCMMHVSSKVANHLATYGDP